MALKSKAKGALKGNRSMGKDFFLQHAMGWRIYRRSIGETVTLKPNPWR